MYTYTTTRALQQHRFQSATPTGLGAGHSNESKQPRLARLLGRVRVGSPITASLRDKGPVTR